MFDLEHICQFAGILTIVGAMFLIFKQKIYLDAQTKKVMYVELPKVGKLQTNAPALAVIVLGFAAVVYPVHLSHTTYLTVEQDVESESLATVNAYAVSKQATVGNDKHLTISFPNLPDDDYTRHLVFHVGNQFWEQNVDLKTARHGKIELPRTHLINLFGAVFWETGVAQGISADLDGRPVGTDRRTVGIVGAGVASGESSGQARTPVA